MKSLEAHSTTSGNPALQYFRYCMSFAVVTLHNIVYKNLKVAKVARRQKNVSPVFPHMTLFKNHTSIWKRKIGLVKEKSFKLKYRTFVFLKD